MTDDVPGRSRRRPVGSSDGEAARRPDAEPTGTGTGRGPEPARPRTDGGARPPAGRAEDRAEAESSDEEGDPGEDRFIEELCERRAASPPMSRADRDAALAVFASRSAFPGGADRALPVAEDSADTPIAGMRGPRLAEPRYLVLRPEGAEIRLEITAEGSRRDIVGRLDPPASGSVELHRVGGLLRAELDDDGGFVAPGHPRGPVRFLFRPEGRPPLGTTWFTI